MFFILSKLLLFLLSPFNLAVIVAVVSIFVKRIRKKGLILSLFILLVFSNPLLLRLTVQWWEGAPQSLPKNDSSIGRVVVLGGMSSYYSQSDRVRFSQSGDRLMQALMLYKQNQVETIIISGGSAAILVDQRAEGGFLSEFLISMGVDSAVLAVDSLSRNTYENAINTSGLFNKKGWERSITLVTSAWHMPRAKRCFEKQGFEVKSIGADFFYPNTPLMPSDFFIPSVSALSTWELLIKEWVGIVVYKIKGFI